MWYVTEWILYVLPDKLNYITETLLFRPVLSNFNVNTNYLESLLQNSNSAGLARALIFCLSNKLLGEADAAGWKTII